MKKRLIYCCACGDKVEARLTSGAEIYPSRPDLRDIPLWRCDTCKNHVGCHHKTTNPTHPLGVIPTPELRKARSHIHDVIDPLWKSKGFRRAKVYAEMTKALGWSYHTANIRTIEEARDVYQAAVKVRKALIDGKNSGEST